MSKVVNKMVVNGEEVTIPGSGGVTMKELNEAISLKISSETIKIAQTITEDEYNALTEKVPTTLYVIPEEE